MKMKELSSVSSAIKYNDLARELLFKREDCAEDQIEKLKKITLNYLEENNIDEMKAEETSANADVVMVFALKEEREQAFKALGLSETQRSTTYNDKRAEYGLTYQAFQVENLNVVSVTQTQMGMAMASSLVTRAILAFKPKLVVMTGICAGREEKINIGDILVADQVYDYTAGKLTKEEKLVRPHTETLDNTLKDILLSPEFETDKINEYIRSKWNQNIPGGRSNISIKAMGSGTSVIDDDKTIFEAAKSQDDLYGIDMEAYGFALAAKMLHIPWLVLKGIQDFGDGEKNKTEENARMYAAFASAVVAGKIIPLYFS